MKKLSAIVTVLVFLGTASCKKKNSSSNTYTPDCTGTTPAFVANVQPLILSSCGNSGCHNAGSQQGPGALTNFTEIKSAVSAIRSSVVSGRMPKGSTLTTAQKNTLVCWIDGGAPNN